MFERRLKVFLSVIIAIAAVMVLRAVQLQVLQHATWQTKADKAMWRWTLVDTPRGEIWDRKGVRLAYDDACIDAAVDYGAILIEPDPAWLKARATARLRARGETASGGRTREQLIADEVERVKVDVEAMWSELARVSGKSAEEITEARQEVKRRVLLLQRNFWYKRFEKNAGKESPISSKWARWLVDARLDDPLQQHDADLKAAEVVIGEQTQSHVILPNISNDVEIELRKRMSLMPGLELRESTHRKYDLDAAVAACHLLGRVTPVDDLDVGSESNKNADPLRKYLPRDLKGRVGLEGLAESLLRGSKGQLVRTLGKKEPIEAIKPIAGGRATASIDLGLQRKVLESFKTLVTHDAAGNRVDVKELHGAAVAIDVKTNEVLVLASYPTYDLNDFEANYVKWRDDDLHEILLNRATSSQQVPGSTVKPIIGTVSVTDGVIRYDAGIACTGYMVYYDYLTGKERRIMGTNRCWVASMFADKGVNVSGHQIPLEDPHTGKPYGNPVGYLTVADAIERSCNIYFQTVADRMHLSGVVAALAKFGLGQRTGIGIPEASGFLPVSDGQKPRVGFESERDRRTAWLAGIGQGHIAATPLQMANVAATLARGGIWKRPRLLTGESAKAVYDPLPNDTRDLNLAPMALAEVKRGMIGVTQHRAGSGGAVYFPDLVVPGKTGSAQVGKFTTKIRDAHGEFVREPGIAGKPGHILHREWEPGNSKGKASEVDWYYMAAGDTVDHLAHAWFIGYAPAENPTIAFCCFVEYGGSGGQVAGALARDLIVAARERGYVRPPGATARAE